MNTIHCKNEKYEEIVIHDNGIIIVDDVLFTEMEDKQAQYEVQLIVGKKIMMGIFRRNK